MHTPVFLQEVIDGLSVRSDGVYIDATVGEGGHLQKIASRAQKVLALELSNEQLQRTQDRLGQKNITYMNSNFSQIEKIAREQGFTDVDGVLFDLGLSMWELNGLGKGFSFEKPDEPLDMRLGNEEQSAADILNTLTGQELYEVLSSNSEEPRSKEIAQMIVENRKRRRFFTVKDLVEVLDSAVGQNNHRTYSRVFQALRMQVNHEKDNLKKGIEGANRLLKTGGRLAVISFHSVEDRIVKRSMTSQNLKLIVKKTPSTARHKFERSATLRIGEKTS